MDQPSHCLNCGARLHGPYCHACGQPVKGMVRHLKSIVHDFLDTVFEYDSRIWRSLVPLYLRPGRITNEFLAGKRVRFVLPFRLFFVLTVVAFLALQVIVEPELEVNGADANAIQDATAVAEREEAARAEGREPPPATGQSGLTFNGERWDMEANPLEIDWLPQGANTRLNRWIARAERNFERAQEDPGWMLDAFLSLLPAALFVLMPLFALLLKLLYIGKRWLYTAHLVVALHSHSFLALALLVSVLLDALADAAGGAVWAAAPLGFLYGLSLAWIPLYLLIMQKRVYAQGWGMTALKYCTIGTIYVTILSFTMVTVAAISLVVA